MIGSVRKVGLFSPIFGMADILPDYNPILVIDESGQEIVLNTFSRESRISYHGKTWEDIQIINFDDYPDRYDGSGVKDVTIILTINGESLTYNCQLSFGMDA